MKTLVISDGKPGHINQARALCTIMGWEGIEVVVDYPFRPAKGATYILDWLGIYTRRPFVLKPADPSAAPESLSEHFQTCKIVVAVGSASYYPAKALNRKMGVPVIALMYPRGFKLDFDHILCPIYDNPPRRSTITTLPITLCKREPSYYQERIADFGKQFAYSLPAVSVIIGGDNKYEHLSTREILKQMELIFALTPGHQHWVTTSRRTSPEVENIVKQFSFDYKLIYSKQPYNPIPAFLMLSDYIFVTSDSSSMVSECVSTGRAKVEILKNVSKKKNKFDRFLEGLQDAGCIHIFDGSLGQAAHKIPLETEVTNALSKVISQIEQGRRSV